MEGQGYPFEPSDDHWRLNKDVQIALALPGTIDVRTEVGFRSTLLRYAEEASARHTRNMETRFKRYLRDTGASQVTVVDLINWRASLAVDEQYQLGGLKGFLLAWHDYGFEGVTDEVVDLLQGWRIQGNEKGAAVASGCPESGPYTDLEMAAILDWANLAVARKDIAFEDYAYLLTLAMTARRPVQIAALRGQDLVREVGEGAPMFRLNIPRAKQRGLAFRGAYRSLAILEDLYLVLRQQHRQPAPLLERIKHRQPVTYQELGVDRLGTAKATLYGMCVHDYAMAPCQKQRECMTCKEHVCVKGDHVTLDRIRLLEAQTEKLLQQAMKAHEDGDFGADRWVDNHKWKLAHVKAMRMALEHPSVPEGAALRIPDGHDPSPVRRALEDLGVVEVPSMEALGVKMTPLALT